MLIGSKGLAIDPFLLDQGQDSVEVPLCDLAGCSVPIRRVNFERDGLVCLGVLAIKPFGLCKVVFSTHPLTLGVTFRHLASSTLPVGFVDLQRY